MKRLSLGNCFTRYREERGPPGRMFTARQKEGNHHGENTVPKYVLADIMYCKRVRTALPQAGMGERRYKEAGVALLQPLEERNQEV